MKKKSRSKGKPNGLRVRYEVTPIRGRWKFVNQPRADVSVVVNAGPPPVAGRKSLRPGARVVGPMSIPAAAQRIHPQYAPTRRDRFFERYIESGMLGFEQVSAQRFLFDAEDLDALTRWEASLAKKV